MRTTPITAALCTAAAALAASASAANVPPADAGCGDSGLTQSTAAPNVTLPSEMTLRSTGRVRIVLRDANQTAAASVRVVQHGGMTLGGTARGTYTCTSDATASSIVAVPLTKRGRRLVRRNGSLRVSVVFHLVNGSGVRNTVRRAAVIRPAG